MKTTIGLIGAGNIGSQLARLASNGMTSSSATREDQRRCASGRGAGPKARAGTVEEAAEAGDIVVVTVPLKAYRAGPSRRSPARSWSTPTTTTSAGRPHPRARQRVDDHVGAAPDAPANVEGRKGIQSHLRLADHDRHAGRHTESARARHRRRRSRCQGGRHETTRSVRLRYGRAGPLEARWRIQRDTPGYGFAVTLRSSRRTWRLRNATPIAVDLRRFGARDFPRRCGNYRHSVSDEFQLRPREATPPWHGGCSTIGMSTLLSATASMKCPLCGQAVGPTADSTWVIAWTSARVAATNGLLAFAPVGRSALGILVEGTQWP